MLLPTVATYNRFRILLHRTHVKVGVLTILRLGKSVLKTNKRKLKFEHRKNQEKFSLSLWYKQIVFLSLFSGESGPRLRRLQEMRSQSLQEYRDYQGSKFQAAFW